MCEPPGMAAKVQQCLSILVLWRACGFGGPLIPVVEWGLKKAWPRIRVKDIDEIDIPLVTLAKCSSKEEAYSTMWKNLPTFEPPLVVVLVQYADGDREGALVHLKVTHMFSDGFCIVPLAADLSTFVAQVEEEVRDGRASTRS